MAELKRIVSVRNVSYCVAYCLPITSMQMCLAPEK